MGRCAKLWNIHIYHIYGGITGHQPQQGRCPKMVTDISNSLYRILWIKKVTIQNFIKIGWKTWKLWLCFCRHRFAANLSESMKSWNSAEFSFSPLAIQGFPQRCSLLGLLGSYNVCLDNLGPNHHLFHEISYPMLSHTCEDRLKTIKFVWKYEISKFP